MTKEEMFYRHLQEEIEDRKEEASIARFKQKVSEIAAIGFGFAGVFLMGGVDSPNWVFVVVLMLLMFSMCATCYLLSRGYKDMAEELEGWEAWRR